MKLRHLLSIDALSQQDIFELIDLANVYLSKIETGRLEETPLQHQFLLNLFFESSTRTRNTFEIAATRLGANVLDANTKTSAIVKGESLADTLLTYEAMGVNYMVIRHQTPQILDNLVPHLLKSAQVINAGDGNNEHPSQTLLDLMTIKKHHDDFSKLKIAILGDLKHSRVANSLIKGLCKVNAKNINLVSPEPLALDSLPNIADSATKVSAFYEASKGLSNADVIFVLRLQKERMSTDVADQLIDYPSKFQLTQELLAHAKPDALVMHAGPINRAIEIAGDVADSPRSLILEQVRNSIPMRMAILHSMNSGTVASA